MKHMMCKRVSLSLGEFKWEVITYYNFKVENLSAKNCIIDLATLISFKRTDLYM